MSHCQGPVGFHVPPAAVLGHFASSFASLPVMMQAVPLQSYNFVPVAPTEDSPAAANQDTGSDYLEGALRCAAAAPAPGTRPSLKRATKVKKAVGEPKTLAKVFPRRKATMEGRQSGAVEITYESLSALFGMPLQAAAEKLGICATAVKKASRKLGVDRWPYRPPNAPIKAPTAASPDAPAKPTPARATHVQRPPSQRILDAVPAPPPPHTSDGDATPPPPSVKPEAGEGVDEAARRHCAGGGGEWGRASSSNTHMSVESASAWSDETASLPPSDPPSPMSLCDADADDYACPAALLGACAEESMDEGGAAAAWVQVFNEDTCDGTGKACGATKLQDEMETGDKACSSQRLQDDIDAFLLSWKSSAQGAGWGAGVGGERDVWVPPLREYEGQWWLEPALPADVSG